MSMTRLVGDLYVVAVIVIALATWSHGAVAKNEPAARQQPDVELRSGGNRYGRTEQEDDEETSAEHALYQALLGGERYQKHVRPVRNHKKPITVKVGMCVMMIEELVERDQIMVMAACVKMVWVDEFLSWNPADYDNLTWMAVSSTSLWLPDIAIINSPEPYSLTRKITNVDLNYKGEIGYFPSGRLATRCNLQITYFPFDWQHCEVRFESWIYPSQFLEIELYPGDAVDLKEYYVNHQWTVTGYRILSEKADYDGKNFSSITFTFTLRRKSSFYFMYFIFPELLLALLQTLSHTLPVEHPGRMTMLTALFIGTSVTHAGIASHIPKSSDTMSLLQIYMAIMSCNLVFALIITFVMLYTVLRYPNEEPCARAMLAAFFSIVWPTRPHRSSNAFDRRTKRNTGLNGYNISEQHDQRQLLLLQRKTVDDGKESPLTSTIRRKLANGGDQQMKDRNHPPAPSSIYEAILASQQSKTADKLASFEAANGIGAIQRENSGAYALSSRTSHVIHDQSAGPMSPNSNNSNKTPLSNRHTIQQKKRSSAMRYASPNNNQADITGDSLSDEVSPQSATVDHAVLHVTMNDQMSSPDGREMVRNPSHPSLSMSGGDANNSHSQDTSGGGGNSTPGAVSLAVGVAGTYYASQQRCLDPNSPSTSTSINRSPQRYYNGDVGYTNTVGDSVPPPPSSSQQVSVFQNDGASILPATRPVGVAFCLDEEQQAQTRKRVTGTLRVGSNGDSAPSGPGGGGSSNPGTPAKSSKSGGGDDDLKRRWLLYCVALDKSIMYANGIWNLTLPVALFWIVPLLHEAMLSPQLDR